MGAYHHDHNVDAGVNRRWQSFIVCTGYDGVTAANEVRNSLPKAIMTDIGHLLFPSPSSMPTPGEILASIKNTFLAMDEYVHSIASRAMRYRDTDAELNLVGEQMGSTALFVGYDILGKRVYVANAGDGRVLLGRRRRRAAEDTDGGKKGTHYYDVHVLVGENEPYTDERPKRMFGAAHTKWSKETHEEMRRHRLDISPLRDLDSTLTKAEPVLATARVRPGDFIIFASRGIWESLTNEEAVGLVGQWLDDDSNNHNTKNRNNRSSFLQSEDLPLRHPTTTSNKSAVCPNHTLWQTPTPKQFISHPNDNDPALHLARNAVGGADELLASWLLSMPLSRSREWRRDMAVGVLVVEKEPLISAIHKAKNGDGEESMGYYTGNDDYGEDD